VIRKAALPLLIFLIVGPSSILAAAREYHLSIAREEVVIQGKGSEGMTINGRIPGPTLYFERGDLARIHVTNKMDAATSIHLHGILLPPAMDGVPFVSQAPIEPGTTFTYEFPIRQTGTYWYHSHSELQEQSGLYGSIVIAEDEFRREADQDHVVLLSDWTTDDPHEVMRTLKRGSEWFALEKGGAQSVLGAARANSLGAYFFRELQRMPPMDIADVAFNYFLANGEVETEIPARPGETVRLRIIDGSSSTNFHLEYAGGPMTVITADGQPVESVEQQRFLIAVAETYDVLVTVPDKGAFEFRATAHDGSGHASVWIGDGKRHPAPDIPRPNLYQGMRHAGLASLFALTPAGVMGMPDSLVEQGRFDRPGMMGMAGMEHDHAEPAAEPMPHMDHMPGHDHQDMPGPPPTSSAQPARLEHEDHAAAIRSARPFGSRFGFLAADIASRERLADEGSEQRPLTPYAVLRSAKPTSLPAGRPLREIRLTLDGDMKRFVWFLDNKPLSEADSILIKEGENVRFIMINRTMMHHPMHLHGHLFRVVNGQGDRAPLKHTVDVAPMSTTVIEFYGDEVGDWFFHCHLLYHMESGMANVVHYQDFEPGPEVRAVRPRLYRDPWFAWARADVLSNMTEGEVSLSNARIMLGGSWEVGWQDVDKTDWEGIVTAGWYLNRFTSFFTGVNGLGEGWDTEDLRGILGLKYLLPLNLESTLWADTEAGGRFILEKELSLTPRLGLHGEVEYDTHDQWEGSVGLHCQLARRATLIGKWHSEHGFGGGLSLAF
jgi:CopA family copper-resistance protein